MHRVVRQAHEPIRRAAGPGATMSRHLSTWIRAVMAGVVLLLSMGSASCAWTDDTIPKAPVEFARSDYHLGAETTGEACRSYAFGISWGALFGRDTTSHGSGGVLGLLTGERVTPEGQEAMFLALERADEATHLIAPRVRNTFAGFGTVGLPLFGKRCGTVWARTATIGEPIDRVLAERRTGPAAEPPAKPAEGAVEDAEPQAVAPEPDEDEGKVDIWGTKDDSTEVKDDAEEKNPDEYPAMDD